LAGGKTNIYPHSGKKCFSDEKGVGWPIDLHINKERDMGSSVLKGGKSFVGEMKTGQTFRPAVAGKKTLLSI